MIVAIDAGNTNVTFALMDGLKVVKRWRMATERKRTADEYRAFLSSLMTIERCAPEEVKKVIVASVVPQAIRPLCEMSETLFGRSPLVVGDEGVDIGIDIQVERPQEVGADRLVNAVAARHLYPGASIVVDFGTATTFDVAGEDGAYLGGVIAPGINLSLEALALAAAKLPRIEAAPPASGKATGKSTLHAMQSGIFYGYLGLIEGIVARIRAEHAFPFRVIATGGLAGLFLRHTAAIEENAPDLTLIGLALIAGRNER